MSSGEVSKWAQTDDPVEATAIFPPDEPQGWPAKEYKRATVYYFDSVGHTVNVASPSGAISTSEYNQYGDVVRALSPDNRSRRSEKEANLKKSAKLMDSESTYNTSGSEPGVELLSTLGSLHTVKLANGTQVEARLHTVYELQRRRP